jgi:hypothetical protein
VITILFKFKFTGILTIFLSVAAISSLGAYAESSNIPDWVKNNAAWWADGQIGESDFLNGMQYLVSQGILEIPITEVSATSISLSEDETAQSFVVHYNGGDYFIDPLTIFSYSQFVHISDTVNSGDASSFRSTPTFFLRSLPSLDKAPIYELVDKYVNAGQKPTMFDVSIEVLSGNGSLIQTWEYRKCAIVDYATYVDDDKDEYPFGDQDKAEIRDVLVVECGGFGLRA